MNFDNFLWRNQHWFNFVNIGLKTQCTQIHIHSQQSWAQSCGVSAHALPPVVNQIPHIFVHFHALSVFGGGNLSLRSFHRSLQSLNLSLQSVLCLLRLECDLVGGHSASLGIAEPHHSIHYVGSSACQRWRTTLRSVWWDSICRLGGSNALLAMMIHGLVKKLLQASSVVQVFEMHTSPHIFSPQLS